MDDQTQGQPPAPDWRKTLDDADAIGQQLNELLKRIDRERSHSRRIISNRRRLFVAVAVAIVAVAPLLYLSDDARNQALGAGVLGGLISGVLILFSQEFRPLEKAMKGFLLV